MLSQKDLKRVIAKPLMHLSSISLLAVTFSEVEKYLAGVKPVALSAFPALPPVTEHTEDAGTEQSDQYGSVCPDCWLSDLSIDSVSKLDSAAEPGQRD